MRTTASEKTYSTIERVAFLAYGVAAYLIGMGALVGLILTLLGIVPVTGGPLRSTSFATGLAVDVGLLLAFALQHSVMARPSFKRRWTRRVPPPLERATFVLASAVFLVALLLLWQPMPDIVWSVETPALRWSLYGLATAGWAYQLASTYAINHFELFGLQQAWHCLRGRPASEPPFLERWMYRFDRHPIMSGFLIGMWAAPTMALDHFMLAVALTFYICIGVRFEERSLLRQWGPVYDAYRDRVGSLVPTPWIRRAPALAVSHEAPPANGSSPWR